MIYGRFKSPRKWIPLLFGILLGLALFFVTAWGVGEQQAKAALGCNSDQAYWDSAYLNAAGGMTVYGAKANINTKNPALCTTNAAWSWSGVWDMLVGSDYCGYAQTGYVRLRGDSTVQYFTEYRRDCPSSYVRKRNWGSASGTQNYWVTYRRDTGKVAMGKGSSTLDTTSFAIDGVWPSPWTSQWSGEVHDYGDDMPGTSSSPAYFSSMQWQTAPNGAWVSPSGLTSRNDSTRNGLSWDSMFTQFHIWTN